MRLKKSFQDFDCYTVVGWLGRLMQYDFNVNNMKGITHVVADTLSRRPLNSLT